MRISDWSSDVCSSDLGFIDLIETLGDQIDPDPVARHEGKARLEEIQTAERRKFVEHHQELMLAFPHPVGIQLLGQATADLVEHQTHKRLGPDRKSTRLNSRH